MTATISTAALFGGSLSPRRFWTGGRGCPVGAGEGGLLGYWEKFGCRISSSKGFPSPAGDGARRERHEGWARVGTAIQGNGVDGRLPFNRFCGSPVLTEKIVNPLS